LEKRAIICNQSDAIKGHGLEPSRLNRNEADFFTVVFYGWGIFCCKVTQFCVTRCKAHSLGVTYDWQSVQRCENMRKNSFFN